MILENKVIQKWKLSKNNFNKKSKCARKLKFSIEKNIKKIRVNLDFKNSL